MTEQRVIWVLGAGFSHSLGGPLLEGLFLYALNERIVCNKALQDVVTWDDLRPAACKYWGAHEGTTRLDLRDKEVNPHPRAWANAEEFLEYVDAAADGEINAQSLIGALETMDSYEDLAKAARQYLAASCEHFMVSATDAARFERWRPYVRWADTLQPQDVVITFNYDRVVEVASTEPQSGYVMRQPWLPRGTRLDETGTRAMTNEEHAKLVSLDTARPHLLLKLHGSVNWQWLKGGAIDTCDVQDALGGRVRQAIALPGPTKAEHKTETSAIWTLARKALEDADAIVFVGYGFPPTDADARHTLLTAITDNPHHDLVVRTVLGPPSDRSRRVDHMLGWALRRRDLGPSPEPLSEPLLAEDFLSVFERQRLFER